MNLDLSTDEVGALEGRTEGWIAGLQLAAISLQGREDAAGFIASFAGSHHFVLDYLVEEVLQRQSEPVQAFLLRTSILDRLCGPLCDAVLLDASAPGQETLEYLDRANLFIVPLDSERRWYRYHHLFADLLRQRRQQIAVSSGAWMRTTSVPASGMRPTASRSKPSSMLRLAMTSSGPSASSRATGCRCTFVARWSPSFAGWSRSQRRCSMPGRRFG